MSSMRTDKENEDLDSTEFPDDGSSVQASQAVIGPKISIRGEIIGKEDILIQGYIEGKVDFTKHKLTVGKGGTLKANAVANEIVINGNVEGDVFGEKRVTIMKEGNLQGNIVAGSVSIEAGAQFHGSIEMDISKRPIDVAKAKSAPANTATTAQIAAASRSKVKRALAKEARLSEKESSARLEAAASQEKAKRALVRERRAVDNGELQELLKKRDSK